MTAEDIIILFILLSFPIGLIIFYVLAYRPGIRICPICEKEYRSDYKNNICPNCQSSTKFNILFKEKISYLNATIPTELKNAPAEIKNKFEHKIELLAYNMVITELTGKKIPFPFSSFLSAIGLFPRLITGELQPIDTDILLSKNESCYFVLPVSLYQKRSRTQYYGRSQGVNIRIMKGVSYRIGEFKGTPVREEYQSLEEEGSLYLTDKAIYYVGNKSIEYPFEKLIKWDRFGDTFVFIKKGQKKQYSFIANDFFCAVAAEKILSYLLSLMAGKTKEELTAEYIRSLPKDSLNFLELTYDSETEKEVNSD